MIHRLSAIVSEAQDGLRLDHLVAEWLPGALGRAISRSTVRRLIVGGAVRINGRSVRRPAWALAPGLRLEALVDDDRLPAGAEEDGPGWRFDASRVIYRDDWLLAIAKPAGLAMHATADASRRDLYSEVAAWLAAETPGADRGEGGTYLGLHHRLDRETSGVVLFTIAAAANGGLAAAFAGREVHKVYHALTVGAAGPREPWDVRDCLAMTGTGRRARMAAAAGGEEARTSFRVLERLREALLVEARPETGRRHQVRAHLAGARLPILGDVRYGGPSRMGGCEFPRVMLHAARLVVRHPVTAARLDLAAPYPDDFLAALRCLRPSPRESFRRKPSR